MAWRFPFMVTARAENHIRGNPDLDDTIARLQAYEQVGADVLYAPGPYQPEDIKTIVAAVSPMPVNVLVSRNTGLKVSDFAGMGVRRISVGSTLSRAAWSGFMNAAQPIAKEGSFSGFDAVSPFADINGFFREIH